MNKTPDATRAAALKCLIDGASIRATERMTGMSKGAILRLLAEGGLFCEMYHDVVVRNLPTTRAEADEQWSYVGCKQRNATKAGQGDVWAYTAIDADSKLLVSWVVGARCPENANAFIADLASRCPKRIQLSTDGERSYPPAVRRSFGFGRVDFARIVKAYGQGHEGGQRRYSPPVVIGVTKERVIGNPDMDLCSTSYVERFNLNTRMTNRRFTRLTNAFSKSAENHAHAVALTFFAHNFLKAHGTLTKAAKKATTPAMACRLTDHVWTCDELVAKMNVTTLVG